MPRNQLRALDPVFDHVEQTKVTALGSLGQEHVLKSLNFERGKELMESSIAKLSAKAAHYKDQLSKVETSESRRRRRSVHSRSEKDTLQRMIKVIGREQRKLNASLTQANMGYLTTPWVSYAARVKVLSDADALKQKIVDLRLKLHLNTQSTARLKSMKNLAQLDAPLAANAAMRIQMTKDLELALKEQARLLVAASEADRPFVDSFPYGSIFPSTRDIVGDTIYNEHMQRFTVDAVTPPGAATRTGGACFFAPVSEWQTHNQYQPTTPKLRAHGVTGTQAAKLGRADGQLAKRISDVSRLLASSWDANKKKYNLAMLEHSFGLRPKYWLNQLTVDPTTGQLQGFKLLQIHGSYLDKFHADMPNPNSVGAFDVNWLLPSTSPHSDLKISIDRIDLGADNVRFAEQTASQGSQLQLGFSKVSAENVIMSEVPVFWEASVCTHRLSADGSRSSLCTRAAEHAAAELTRLEKTRAEQTHAVRKILANSKLKYQRRLEVLAKDPQTPATVGEQKTISANLEEINGFIGNTNNHPNVAHITAQIEALSKSSGIKVLSDVERSQIALGEEVARKLVNKGLGSRQVHWHSSGMWSVVEQKSGAAQFLFGRIQKDKTLILRQLYKIVDEPDFVYYDRMRDNIVFWKRHDWGSATQQILQIIIEATPRVDGRCAAVDFVATTADGKDNGSVVTDYNHPALQLATLTSIEALHARGAVPEGSRLGERVDGNEFVQRYARIKSF